MPANETLDLAKALTEELQIPVLQLVINRVLNVLFAENERPVVEGLPSDLPADSEIMGLAVAGKRRVLRESVQAKAVRKVRGAIDAPCSELPYYESLENDRAAVDALSEALLQCV
jgi:hypothetical protein